MLPLMMKAEAAPVDAAPVDAVLGDDGPSDAVRRRDLAGAFVYGVRTTGIYCLPSCGARLPRRENVGFYATCADAEQAGLRTCKRRQPHETQPA